ncbi:hypothetical protein ABZ570_20705 [Micromonospora sp. NPDC007271]|uniref:esterase/lipase family protein n=1 Tax=Micromonospora sp. NPDC007271 TaxID=3154587 RepID=UPI00340E5342
MSRPAAASAALLLVAALAAPPAAHAAADAAPPRECGTARLADPERGRDGSIPGLRPHADGRFTPVLLVHGWNGSPETWSQPITYSTLPNKPSVNHSLLGNLQGLAGAAVYTLDYHDVAHRWFALPGAGGELFVEAENCLAGQEAFQGHKTIVIAHSMGGLVTRWAVSDAAPDGAQRRGRIGLVVTLGTPYEGSWLAELGTSLLDTATDIGALRDKRVAALLEVIHLLLVQCEGVDLPGCRELTKLADQLATVRAFVPGSPELAALSGWPAGMRVHTLTSRTVLEDAAGGLFALRSPGELDLGDVVVGTDSATAGDFPERIGECRLTMSLLRNWVNDRLVDTGRLAKIDAPSHMFLGLFADCFHVNEARIIQLTNEALGIVADELAAQGPLYAYRAVGELGIVRMDRVAHRVRGTFVDAQFTDDGRYLAAVERAGRPNARVVTISVADGHRADLPCGGCTSVAPAGQDRVAWLDRAGKLVQANAAGGPGSAPVALRLPKTAEFTEHQRQGITASTVRIHAGVHGRFLVSRQYHEATDTTETFLVDADGSAEALDDNGFVGATAVTPGGTKLAYARGYQYEAASADIDVAVVDPDKATRTVVDSQQLAAGIYHAGYGPAGEVVAVHDLWWGYDGKLYATIGSQSFLPWTQDMETVIPKSLWRLDGQRWVSVDAGPLLAVRQLTRSTKAVVTADGTLYTETDGRGVKVATKVEAILVPPRAGDPQAAPSGKKLTRPKEPCLSKADFNRTASRLGSGIFEGSKVTVTADRAGVTCQGGWAGAWTTIAYGSTGVGRESYVILRYGNGRWSWGVDTYWQQLGEPTEMCQQIPPKLKPTVHCP